MSDGPHDDTDPDMDAETDARELAEAAWLRWLSSEGEHE